MRWFLCSIIAMLSAFTFAGCGETNDPVSPKRPMQTTICLNIGLLDIPSGTRTDAYSFEAPANDYEKVHTLRVIIVRPDGTVEHNRFLSYDTPIERTSQTFKVIGMEKKKIYLFANELTDSKEWNGYGYYDYSEIKKGEKFPAAEMDSLKLMSTRMDDNVLFDNTGDFKIWIPINEQYEYELTSDQPGTPENPSETFSCFITRAAVKFSFEIAQSDGGSEGYEVTEITVNNGGFQEYLLPCNTIYNPGKYIVSTDPLGGRMIESFSLPLGAVAEGMRYVFHPTGFGVGSVNDISRSSNYSPAYYFAESKPWGDGYTVKLKVKWDGDSKEQILGPAKLPNLPSCPRNTHVRIRFSFKDILESKVDVLPYTGVYLDPGFGIIPSN